MCNDGRFAKLAEQIGAPELASDARIANSALRSAKLADPYTAHRGMVVQIGEYNGVAPPKTTQA